MIELYPHIRAVHIGAVLVSGTLFALRGAGVQMGARWPLAVSLRRLSWIIDSVLLIAALMLVAMLPSAVFANQWLTAKLVLLALYIVCGSFAIKRGRSARVRAACFTAALVLYGAMFGIARLHHPLGWFADTGPGAALSDTRGDDRCTA